MRQERVSLDPCCLCSAFQAALHCLGALRINYEAYHGVSIQDEAMRAAVSCAHRFVTERRLPDSAVDLLDEAAALARLQAPAAGSMPPLPQANRDARPTGPPVVQPPAAAAAVALGAIANRSRVQSVESAEATWCRPCPHCGFAVPNDRAAAKLSCPRCGTAFLNIPPEKLLLGVTMLPQPKRHGADTEGRSSTRSGSDRIAEFQAEVLGSPHAAAGASRGVPASPEPSGSRGVPASPEPSGSRSGRTDTVGPGEATDVEATIGPSASLPVVTAEHVVAVAQRMTGVPVGDLVGKERETLAGLDALMSQQARHLCSHLSRQLGRRLGGSESSALNPAGCLWLNRRCLRLGGAHGSVPGGPHTETKYLYKSACLHAHTALMIL